MSNSLEGSRRLHHRRQHRDGAVACPRARASAARRSPSPISGRTISIRPRPSSARDGRCAVPEGRQPRRRRGEGRGCGRRAGVRPGRYPGQQRRHQRHACAYRGGRRGVLRQHVRHARQRRVLRGAGRRAGDEAAPVRPDHQHRLDLRHDRLAGDEPLHHVEGRAHRADARLGARARLLRHHRQHRLAGTGGDADDPRRPHARAHAEASWPAW